MTLDEQIKQALAALPKERKRFIVVPKRPKAKGGKRRSAGPSIIVLKRTGNAPWYIWRAENAWLRIIIQRVNFSDTGYSWEIVSANDVRLYHGVGSFQAALTAINNVLEHEGYRWRVRATPLRAGGKARHAVRWEWKKVKKNVYQMTLSDGGKVSLSFAGGQWWLDPGRYGKRTERLGPDFANARRDAMVWVQSFENTPRGKALR
jgi:hypothetical protein